MNNHTVKKLRGTCVACQRHKSPIEGDQTIQAEYLGDFSYTSKKSCKEFRKESTQQSWKSFRNCSKNWNCSSK